MRALRAGVTVALGGLLGPKPNQVSRRRLGRTARSHRALDEGGGECWIARRAVDDLSARLNFDPNQLLPEADRVRCTLCSL